MPTEYPPIAHPNLATLLVMGPVYVRERNASFQVSEDRLGYCLQVWPGAPDAEPGRYVHREYAVRIGVCASILQDIEQYTRPEIFNASL